MFCSKCGKKLEEDMQHCPYCGAKVKAAAESKNAGTVQKNAGGSKRKLPIIAIGAAALIIVLVIVINMFTGGVKINAMDYAKLRVDGLNTEGVARVVFDTDALLTLIEQEKTLTERDKEVIEVLVSDAYKDFALSKNSGLSNGDEVEITSNLEKKLLKDYGVIIKNGSSKFTVENLIDFADINLADYVVLDESGFEGYGSAYVYLDWEGLRAKAEAQILAVDPSQIGKDYAANELNWVLNSISLSPSYVENLSTGDEVTIEIEMKETVAEKYGLRFTTEAAVKTVEGLMDTETVSVMNYVSIETEGFSGDGDAYVIFDEERLAADLQVIFEEKQRGASYESYENMDYASEAADAADSILYSWRNRFFTELSAEEDLKNGDVITVTSTLDSEDAFVEYIGYYLEGGTAEFTVGGLIEPETIAVMDYIELPVSGFSGAGTAELIFNKEKLAADLQPVFEEKQRGAYGESYEDMDYASEAVTVANEIYYRWKNDYQTEISSTVELKNEDVVTVTSTLQGETNYLSSMGCYLECSPREYIVQGLLEPEIIDVMSYVGVQTSGFNGAGTAEWIFDKEKLAADLQLAFEEKQRGAYGAAYEGIDYANEAVRVADEIYYVWNNNYLTELSAVNELKNEDIVTVTSTLQGETSFIAEVGCSLECIPVEFTVQNLEEPQEVDLADAMTVTYSGTCPIVYMDIAVDYNLPYVYQTSLPELDNDRWAVGRNGDQYEGEITYDEMELLKLGYTVSNNKFSYPISGLNTYEITGSTLDEEVFQKLDKVVFDSVKDMMSKNYEDIVDSVGEGPNWIGWDRSKIVLENGKHVFRQNDRDAVSRIYFVYHGAYPIRMLDRTEVEKDVYGVVCFKNVEETPEGTLWFDEDYECNLYMNQEDAVAYINSKIQELGEEAEVKELLWENPEEVSVELINAVSEEAVVLETAAAGEIQGNAANLAANVITYEGHTYARYDTNLNWALAKQFCEAAGGHLATVTSEKEAAVIELLLNEAPFGTYWLGATDEGWEGGWQWITGEAFDWTDWKDGQPDNANRSEEGEENYLETGKSHSHNWNDNYASYTEGGFILEVDPAEEVADSKNVTELHQMKASSMNNSEIWKNVQDSYGNQHFYSLAMEASENAITYYDLNGEWAAFSGTISTYAEADSEVCLNLQIWGDNKLLYSCYDYDKTDAPRPFQIDVTGVDVLSIQTSNRGTYSNGWMFIHEGKFVKAEECILTEEVYRLGELNFVDAKGYENSLTSGMSTDFYGNSHGDWNSFDLSKSGYAMLQLNGEYTAFEATIVTTPAAYSHATSAGVEILADGTELFRVDDYTVYDGAVDIAVDLTGKNTLEIRTWSNQEYPSGYICIVDTAIKKTVEEVPAEAEEALEFPEIPSAVLVKAADVITCGNYRYYRFDEPLTWQNAAAFCQAAGGVLACPDTPEKNEAVTVLIADGLWKEYMIGGSNNAGVWSWNNGNSFGEYTNWANNQPDNHDEKEYLMSMYENGTWNDLAADVKSGFVMEVKAIAGLQAEEVISVADLEWTESKRAEICNTIDKEQNLQVGSIQMDTSNEAFFKVDLNGQYSVFSGSISPTSKASANVDMQVAIFGDGKCLYSRENITKASKEIDFAVDVSGVKKLTVMTWNRGSYDWGLVFLENANLEQALSPETAGVTRLAELIDVDTVKTDKEYSFFQDAYGNVHERYLRMNAREGAAVLYNLDGKYTAFKGMITAAREKTVLGVTAKITFLADNEEIHTIDFEKSNGAAEFEIDLTGKRVLEIRVQNLEEGKDNMVYLTNDQLY